MTTPTALLFSATLRKCVLLLVFLACCSAAISAQTCRVNCGKGENGQITYREVFEYDYVSEKPTFPGGDSRFVSYINNNRRYPAEAYRRGIQGRVTCTFVVNANGTISNVRVLKGVEASLNQEAVRILTSMPKWHPGKIDGQPVPVRVIWPIPFRR